jgi:predicted glycosyltransferase
MPIDDYFSVRADRGAPSGEKAEMRFELLPLLEADARRQSAPQDLSIPRCTDGIFDAPPAGRDEEASLCWKKWFDGVLVHSHPDLSA